MLHYKGNLNTHAALVDLWKTLYGIFLTTIVSLLPRPHQRFIPRDLPNHAMVQPTASSHSPPTPQPPTPHPSHLTRRCPKPSCNPNPRRPGHIALGPGQPSLHVSCSHTTPRPRGQRQRTILWYWSLMWLGSNKYRILTM